MSEPMTWDEIRRQFKRHKFRAQATVVNGIRFDSKREARQYQLLKALADSGNIFGFRLQPKYSLTVNGVHICDYVADFCWHDKEGKLVVADAKGVRTREYKLKRALMRAVLGIEIVEL